MGGKIVLPEPDDNIQKVIKNFNFTPKDISDFWKIFNKYVIVIIIIIIIAIAFVIVNF